MSVRSLIAMNLLILCAVTTGCGTSAGPKANPDSLAASSNAAPPRKTAEEQAAEKKADDEQAAEKKATEKKAAEKKAAEEKAAANSYVKVKVEVELRGVLTCTDEAATLSIVTPLWAPDQFEEVKWVIDFGEDKAIRAKAKSLDGKTVLVTGSAILRGIKIERRPPPPGTLPKIGQENKTEEGETKEVLDLEPKVAVKSLFAATK